MKGYVNRDKFRFLQDCLVVFDWSRVALRPRLGDFHLSPDDDQSTLSMTSCTGFELPFILNAIHEILEA